MEITPDTWQRAKAVFDAALQQPREEREPFLASMCAEAIYANRSSSLCAIMIKQAAS
jgi:hypothetical protein